MAVRQAQQQTKQQMFLEAADGDLDARRLMSAI
jgi:hypothetical protein